MSVSFGIRSECVVVNGGRLSPGAVGLPQMAVVLSVYCTFAFSSFRIRGG